jgi:hypothetical protein
MKLFLNIVLLLICFKVCSQTNNSKPNKMKVAVWDTYVTKKDGAIMHFDILAPESIKDTTVIYNYGKDYLKSKGQAGQPLTSKECRFCHVESVRPNWEEAINKQGYFIIEMENCN